MNDETKRRFPELHDMLLDIQNEFPLERERFYPSARVDEITTLLTHWEETQWRPIETAPKDEGVSILAFANGSCTTAAWAGYAWVNDFEPCTIHPTHWMPLPKGPTQ